MTLPPPARVAGEKRGTIVDRATRLICLLGVVFAVLFALATVSQPASGASAPLSAALSDVSPTVTPTPIDLRTCQVGGRQADYGQTWQGMTITPLEQHDVGGYNLWETTWRVVGPVGRTIEAQVVTYRCIGLVRTPAWDHCSAELATETISHTVNVTIPASGTINFSVQSPVNCCEIDENDLLFVNGVPWGASFFVRWAESPLCPFPGPSRTPTVTATPTVTPTPTATATPTFTPTPTATPPFRKRPWHEELQPGYSQRYNITLQNTGGSVMPGVVVTDVLPSGVRFSDATIVVTGTTAPADFSWYAAGGEWDGDRTVVWRVGDLPPGHYASMKVHVYAYSNLPPGTVITNVARMSSGGAPAIETNAQMLIVATLPTPTRQPSPTLTPVPLCPSAPAVLVDVGSNAPYTDTQGGLWQADRAFGGANTWGYTGASAVYSTADHVWGTGDVALYQTERFWTNGNGGYRFTLPNGDYEVLLKFAEIYPGAKVGTRVFSVRIEGVEVLAHLDLMEIAGANTAYDALIPISVADGLLSVDFVAEQSLPALKAIAVRMPRPCTATPTPSATATNTAIATPSHTPTATATETEMATPTATATETEAATPTVSATPTLADMPTLTPTPSATPTAPEMTPTETTQPTPTATMTYLPEKTATGTPTTTPTATGTPEPTATTTSTETAAATATATATTSPPTYITVLPIIIVTQE
jgi:uncharacterized repeat protein (TIGR01451 family)